jgi:hypothetical protein
MFKLYSIYEQAVLLQQLQEPIITKLTTGDVYQGWYLLWWRKALPPPPPTPNYLAASEGFNNANIASSPCIKYR